LLVAGAITGGKVLVKGAELGHMEATLVKLKECGAEIECGPDGILVTARRGINAVDIKTLPYPGFPTDMQPQFASLLSLANGTSVITETVFENRFMHVNELKRMGANIRLEGQSAIITGVPKLSGAPVRVSDLRAGAALILAGLAAEGETIIEDRDHHIRRGYDKITSKLTGLGAEIKDHQ